MQQIIVINLSLFSCIAHALLLWITLAIFGLYVAALASRVDFYKLFNDPQGRLSLTPRLKTDDRIRAHGYPAEMHYVPTEDGYILGLFRIPYSHKLQNQNALRPIVLIQHGLTGCSDNWIAMGPDNAIAFQLADAGYDVWLGNARGTTYSRNHTSRSTQHPYFWRFSWHEVGHYDIAAMIDYALATNGQNQRAIHYIGHSQGTTVFFVLMSTRPEYNAKIKTAHMLAPVAFMDNLSSLLVRTVGPYLGHHNTYSKLFCSQEFLPFNDLVLALFYNSCRPESRFASLCDGVLYDSSTEGRTNSTASAIHAGTSPAGLSTDQFLHYLQEQQSGHFRNFDFGPKKNLLMYGNEAPPDYPTKLITCETHLWYADNDELAAIVDVERLAETLPNKVMHHMEDELWDHIDFAFNWHVKEFINDPVVEIIEEYE
ncbi:lipase 3-like, partial [Drosophila busckii]|uniref:lipase 3-like n=1 Tax=Drosophila busckii TaxID=30019 RepID=UPI00083F098E